VAVSHLVFVSVAGLPSLGHAQGADGEPPTISFERIEEGVLGETQVFSATVADEFSVATVTLHYRFGDEVRYEPLPMEPLAGTDIYTVAVETTDAEEDVLQYYIEARDEAGNRSIQGFAFDPIERRLVAPVVRQAGMAPPPPPRADGMSTGRKVLYGVLGVLAVGAVVAAAGGSGGGSDDNPSSDDPDNVPLDIIVEAFP